MGNSPGKAVMELTTNDMPQLLNILTPIAPKYSALGLQLGVDNSKINIIEHDYSKCQDRLRAIIAERLNHEEPLTWSDIATALRADSVQENRLARHIEQKFTKLYPSVPRYEGTSTSTAYSTSTHPHNVSVLSAVSDSQPAGKPHPHSHSVSLNSLVNHFIDFVKTTYKSSELERGTSVVKWPPTPSKIYINLACIDRQRVKSKEYEEVTEAMIRDGNVDVIEKTKGPIRFDEIATGISLQCLKGASRYTQEQRLILVEGAPGVGKSTFAWEYCRRWERGEIAQQYQLVLLIRLRDDRISHANTLKDLIYHPLEGVAQAVCSELVLSHDFHAMIILEGFDELPDSCRNRHSLFNELISGKLLPRATVLVTSRPWATEYIHSNYRNRIYQHIEILGFTSTQVNEYIKSTLPQDKVDYICAYIDRHPQIRAVMYIPLNSAIVVTVYQESLDRGYAMPSTLTELYIAQTKTLLLRYLCAHPEYGTKTIKSFKDLPPEVYAKFSELCKLAYNSILGTKQQHVQLIFRDLPSDFDNLGFMDSVTELYVTQGTVSSHNFLHLTFQEFFAAVHISTLSITEQLESFKKHEKGRVKVMLKYLAGLSKLHCFMEDTRCHIDLLHSPVYQQHEAIGFSGECVCTITCDAEVDLDLINWLFEAQNPNVIDFVLGQKIVRIKIYNYSKLMDYYALGYVIACSQCQWILSFQHYLIGSEMISDEALSMLVAGISTKKETCSTILALEALERVRSNTIGSCLFHNGCVTRLHSIISAKYLNLLLTMFHKNIQYLVNLELTDPLIWPNLSGLRRLELVFSTNKEWRLDTLLPPLSDSLESLIITYDSNSGGLGFKDFLAIKNFIISAASLKKLYLYVEGCDLNISDTRSMEAITSGLAINQSLSLEILKLDFVCVCTDTAANLLAKFITNTTTLKYFSVAFGYRLSSNVVQVLDRAISCISNLKVEEQTEYSYQFRVYKKDFKLDQVSMC